MSDILAIPCPHCSALNRVPTVRVDEKPNCGRCRQPLFGAHPVVLTAASFDAVALRGDLPVLVDFWAPWCGPCLGFAPVFAQAATRAGSRLRFAKLDTEAQPEPAQRFAIRSIPTLMMFRGGRELARQSGALGAGQLQQFIDATLARV